MVTGGMAVAAADEAAAERDVPLLVCVLAGNSVTSATILACLNTADARHLRRLHPAVAGVVRGVPWAAMDTLVVDPVRWRAGLPAAVGARLAALAVRDLLTSEPAVAAVGGVTHLDMWDVTDDVLARLPISLRTLKVRSCRNLTSSASFAHLTALTALEWSQSPVGREQADSLPPSLQELDISWARGLPDSVSLAHLSQLQALRADWSEMLTDATLASLPPSLEKLHAAGCRKLTPAASFGHLTALRLLDVSGSAISDGSLATMPPCLVFLYMRGCSLTPDAVLPHLPALQLLDVSKTDIGDRLMAGLSGALVELRLAGCREVTAGASLDHLRALRLLHCIDTEIAPAALAACRARGCTVPAASVLRGHEAFVTALALLADGRLASGDFNGEVRVWDVAEGAEATAVRRADDTVVNALAVLQDGRRLVIGTTSLHGDSGCIEVWSVDGVPPTRNATIDCRSSVDALAVLPNGRLAAGRDDGKVKIVDVDTEAVVATLRGHTGEVVALAVLPDGTLVSGSHDASVRMWDVGARACVATLVGHTDGVTCLAVLTDGRLASEGGGDDAVRLWDVGARVCVGVLPGHAGDVTALAALPDGRLATGTRDGTIRLWDTRPAAASGASHAVGVTPVEVVGVLGGSVSVLLSLPDGRLACGGGAEVSLLELPPPAAYE